MARRASDDGGWVGGALLIGAIVLYFVMPILLAVAAYGVLAFILCGFIVSEYRTRPRPSITSEKQFDAATSYLDDESSTLRSLKVRQEELREHKRRVCWHGDHSGLSRRGYDGRFDARGEGKLLNAELTKLDKAFEHIEDQIFQIDLNAAAHRQQKANEFTDWRSKHALLVAFRVGALTYMCTAAVLTILYPLWVQQFSQYVSRSIWLPVSFLASLYGPMVIASVLALGAGTIYWMVYGSMSIEIPTDWLAERRDENVSRFMEPEEIAEAEESDEAQAEWDSEDDEGEHEVSSPYEVLGVASDASRDDIMAAYRELVKQYHPDFQQNRGPKLRELAERETQILNWAKEEALKRWR